MSGDQQGPVIRSGRGGFGLELFACKNKLRAAAQSSQAAMRILVLLGLLVCTLPAVATAAASASQTPKTTEVPSPKKQAGDSAAVEKSPPSPAPIAVAMIALEAEAASFRVRRINLEMDRTRMLSDVESRLEILEGSLQRIRPLLASGDMPYVEELLNVRQQLKRLSLQLLALQADLTPLSQMIEARRQELLKMQLLWKTTLEALNLQEAPPATRVLIIAVQQEIQGLLDNIASSRPVLLTLQGRVSEQRMALDYLVVQADDAIKESEARLFAIDSVPLWKAIGSTTLSSSLSVSTRGFSQRRALPLFDYLREDNKRLWLHVLISILLTMLLIGVSRRSRAWSDDSAGESKTAQVLRHPVAAAAVLSLLLSFNIYPNAPIVLYRLPLVLMAIPLLRLLSAVPARDERVMVYFVTGIYLLRRLDELTVFDDFVNRIVLLVLTTVALWGVCREARAEYRTPADRLGPWRRARMHLLRLAGLLLVASLIANIVGNVRLATLLADGCISSAFAGAALFVGVLTLEGYLIPVLRSPLARMSPAIRKYHALFEQRLSFLVRLGALVIWGVSSVRLFGLSGPILEFVTPVFSREWSLGRVSFSLAAIVLFAVTIWLSAMAARFVGFLLEQDVLPRLSLPRGVPATISMLARDAVIGFGFVLALAGAGLQWSQIVFVAGAIGVGIGLGLQNLVASFVAGLILIFERPIRVGDAVEIGSIMGVVTRIGLRSSTIQTYDGSEVICPNSNLISQELVNWTLSSQIRRVEVQVGAAYGSNPETVLQILTTVAQTHPGVLREPESVALFRGFGDSSLNFVLRCFTSFSDWPAVSSEVGIRVHEALGKAGIEIPFPQRDIRIVSEPPKATETKNLKQDDRVQVPMNSLPALSSGVGRTAATPAELMPDRHCKE